MTALHLTFGAATAFFVAAGFIGFWPVNYEVSPALPDTRASITVDVIGAVDHFDHSMLPPRQQKIAEVVSAPPPDPAATLRGIQYLGMAASGGITVGLFSENGATRILRQDDIIEGYSLSKLDESSAVFASNTGEYVLQITPSAE